MKRFVSAVLMLFVLVSMLFLVNITAFAGDNCAKGWNGDVSDSHFADMPDFFTDAEEQELTDMIRQTAGKLEMNIVVFAADSSYNMSDSQVKRFVRQSYADLFGSDSDGVFYFMDFTGKQPAYDFIFTSGKAVLLYEDHLDFIIDDLLSTLPPSTATDYSLYKDDITATISNFLEHLERYGGSKPRKAYYDSVSGKYFYYKNGELVITTDKPLTERLKALIYAVPVGIVVGLLFFFTTKSKYRFKKSINPYVYVANEETRFLRREDRFIRTYTTKTRIQSNSGGSGGGSSGGGGGSIGGGSGRGGHR